MSNHLVILTRQDVPQAFLVQKFSLDAIREACKLDPFLAEKQVHVFSFKPTPEGIENKFHGIPLEHLHAPVQNPFEHHVQVALYYARINGARDERDELRRAAKQILARLKELDERDNRQTQTPDPT